MNIYNYQNYRLYLKDWIFHQPRHGHGALKAWAQGLGVHSTLLSQIIGGKKDFSLEQADRLTEILNLTELEAEYFMLMLLHERAGSENLRKKFKKKILEHQEKSKNISQRLNVKNVLSEETKAQFYSSWIYSGVRNLAALDSITSAEDIAKQLDLPRDLIQNILQFLIEHGLCALSPKGLTYGPARTHVASDSAWVNQHHRNWRERAQQKMLLQRESDLFFTFPMSLSKKDSEKIRKLLPVWIEEIHKIVEPSPSQTVRCLNMDFFEY